MKVSLKQINGPWDAGWVLDKHTLSAEFIGHDEFGHPRFNTTRSEVGEATFQLKYRADMSRVPLLAQAIADHVYPKLDQVGFIVPMPASTIRVTQPVTEIAKGLGNLVSKPVFENILLKAPTGVSLKDLTTKDEKLAAIGDSLSINDVIHNDGKWNVLIIDDLLHTGASMQKACEALRAYHKVDKIYVTALTWR